jgi:hypothetical protein
LRFFLASNIALALKARQKRSQAGALATTSKCGYTTHIYTTAASHRNDQPFRNAQNLHDAVVVQPDVFLPQRAVEIRVEPEARSQ